MPTSPIVEGMDAMGALASAGGIAFLRDLRGAGVGDREVAEAVELGAIFRLRRGLVALPGLSPDIVRAARVGGRLAGASAARELGLWAPISPLTVAVPEHSGRLWDPDVRGLPLDGAEVRLLRAERPGPRFGVSDLETAIAETCVSMPAPLAIAVADSALRRSLISERELIELDRELPPRGQGILTRCDGRADTGSESVVRACLQDAGLDPIPQARIPFTDLERVDLLLGDRLVVECDSEEHHGSAEARRRDRRRDARLSALGFIVLRFDYRQIMFEIDAVVGSVVRYVDLGLHLF